MDREDMRSDKMNKIKFACKVCGKVLYIDPEPFRRAYKGREECLDCRRKSALSAENKWR